MRNRTLVLTLLAWCVQADNGCPPVLFPYIRSATLAPSPATHRILLRQNNGTYTAFEMTNTPPYSIVRKIPHFEKQLSACLPIATGLDPVGVTTLGQLASGGYIFAMSRSNQGTDIAVFDAGLNLISQALYTNLSPLAFSDLNGDQNPDIIGTAYVGHNQVLAVSLGKGGTSFQPPVFYPISGGLPSVSAVAVADLNGDLKPDLVILDAEPGSGKVSVFFGNGDGTFQAEKLVTSGFQPTALAIADLNGDGQADLAFTASDPSVNTTVVEVALGVGDGTFATPVKYPVPAAGSIAISDVNGDGIPDIITSGITILFGDGKGGFSDRRDVLVETAGNLIVTDFDGDGITDIVIAMGNPTIMAGNAVSVVFGLGKGVFAGPPVSLVPKYPAANTVFTGLATADVNGDGVPDLVSADNLGHVSVLKGVGDGSFQSTFQFTFEFGLPRATVFTDFNHDGKLDLAVVGSGYTSSSSGEVEILLGNGSGTFQSPIHIPAPLGAFALAARDFNDDGKPDLAILVSQEGSGVSDGVLLMLGNGDGTFTAGVTYPVGPFAHSFAVGDFNGDGKLDVVVADAGTYAQQNQDGNISLLAGKGDGTLSAPLVTPLTGGFVRGPYNVIAADFNRDGKLDLALTLSDSSNYKGGMVTMLGRGDGTFQPPMVYAVDAVTVQAGDLDGDGIMDLIVSGNGDSAGLRYLLGNGDGSFGPAVKFSADIFTLYATSPLALADFNRDGKLDVAAIASAGIATFLNATRPKPTLTVVSAASLTPGPVAPDSIATAFGKILPVTAASVLITDSTGTTFPTSLQYVSGSQINFVIPAGLDAGPATLTIGSTNNGSTAQSADVVIAPVAPALFTVNNGGLAAAYVTRVAPGGALTNESIFTLQDGIYTPISIDVTSGQAHLILFGTGIRNGVGIRAVWNGGVPAAVLYAGPQPSFQGLDQVNLPLSASLAGSGCQNLTLTAEGLASNTVYVCIR